ncbi:hypothetical protein [Nocardioides mesophilus]|uniref:Uncharacterized protein n=1 Tax=Nocardioides mesophilus TaxID=433659 RepID=A0A7G9RG08_9ACTN|nr:hypothetical protein [Nocardioides mesophilus]QNN54533.1 hypothetical protein H9L09_09610 [Nocardioides mesophilus]
MTALGTWLLTVALCDLLRATRDTITARHRWLLVALGSCLLVLAGAWLDLSGRGWATLAPVWLVGFGGWVACSSLALDRAARHPARWRGLAFLALLLPGLGLALVGDAVDTGPALPTWLDDSLVARLGAPAAILLAGALLVQVSTANLAVRLLLDAVGVPAVTNEKKLKGGRVLGPMERLFIVGLGLAGSLGAAAVVVAAKGLLRYPELQRSEREEGPTDVSEYFLIGSFASWLLALIGLGLLWLGLPLQTWAVLSGYSALH